MKLIVAAIFAVLTVSAFAASVPVYPPLVTVEPEWVDIDWSQVKPIEDFEGFWDGREIRPAVWPSEAVRSGRIVGGAVATPHSHPYQAGLLMNTGSGTGLCGGSMISTRAILTAAHCPHNTVSTQIILGAHVIQTVEASQQRSTVPSDNYRIHGSYNQANLNNDIAILITVTAHTLTGQIQISNLALATEGSFAGETGQMSGWGRMTNTGGTSPDLRFVTNPIITNAICAETYGTLVIIASTICTSTAGGRGTCDGDSGGPLTIARADVPGGRLQVGVTSFVSDAGCQNGFPAGFVRVSSMRAWINANMNPPI